MLPGQFTTQDLTQRGNNFFRSHLTDRFEDLEHNGFLLVEQRDHSLNRSTALRMRQAGGKPSRRRIHAPAAATNPIAEYCRDTAAPTHSPANQYAAIVVQGDRQGPYQHISTTTTAPAHGPAQSTAARSP
eukprot:scaffold1706_cov113-Isochrysis_galbana.AAC.8